MNQNTIAISITEGRVIRDLFQNRLHEQLLNNGLKLLVLTPAARVPEFVAQWHQPGLTILPMDPYQITPRGERALSIRRRLMKTSSILLQQWLKWERRYFPIDTDALTAFQEHQVSLAVMTHPMFHSEMGIFRAAQEQKIQTLGILRSWDNLYKGLRIRPEILAVWNEVNREEAVHLMQFPREKLAVIGGTQFDPYFAPDAFWTREKFCQTLDLDPTRPIITLATIGSFLHQYDETYMMDVLIQAIIDGKIEGNPQLVCRLHPATRLEQFLRYQEYPFVRLSWITGYIPSLTWTMTRDDVVWVANLLRHSAVVVSPGSTITLETAIFDTPTIVPIFHTYQPKLGQKQYASTLSRHYKRLSDLNLIPIVKEPSALIEAINRFLRDPTWYRPQRNQLKQDYIQFKDGKSTQRLAELILHLAKGN